MGNFRVKVIDVYVENGEYEEDLEAKVNEYLEKSKGQFISIQYALSLGIASVLITEEYKK